MRNREFVVVGRAMFDHFHAQWRKIDADYFDDPYMINLLRGALRQEVKLLAGSVAQIERREADAGSYIIPV